MPRMKDLGIKVIPETLRPPEFGGGGGCTNRTVQAFSICGGTPGGGGLPTAHSSRFRSAAARLAPAAIRSPICICTPNSPCFCTHFGSIPYVGTCGYSNIPYQPAGELTRESDRQAQRATAAADHRVGRACKTLGRRPSRRSARARTAQRGAGPNCRRAKVSKSNPCSPAVRRPEVGIDGRTDFQLKRR